MHENTYLAERNFKLNCDTLNAPMDTRVKVIHVVFRGLSLGYLVRISANDSNFTVQLAFSQMKEHSKPRIDVNGR